MLSVCQEARLCARSRPSAVAQANTSKAATDRQLSAAGCRPAGATSHSQPKWKRPARHARISQRVGQGKQNVHTEQARVQIGAALMSHAAGEQAAQRPEAAERICDEANFVFIKTNFVSKMHFR